MREKVLRDLASRAATDAGFLKQARRTTSNSPVCLPVASEAVPAALQHDLPPRLGADRVRVDRHDPEVDGGGGV